MQGDKNIVLAEKLLDYLQTVKHRSGYSFVVFSKNDKKLNAQNEKLAQILIKEGKKVIKAEETGDKTNPWNLIYA